MTMGHVARYAAAAALIASAIVMWLNIDAPKQPRPSALAPTALMPPKDQSRVGTFAWAGEWIVRDDDGSQVCQLKTNLSYAMVFTAALCEWAVPTPVYGQQADPHWYQCGHEWGGCKLHFENGWRP